MVILKFLMYFSPRLVTMVLPLSVLLTSIMTFGNFAENYEFAAMKSAGISLQRAMRPLTMFILGLAFVSFLFANYVIPAAEFESLNLRRNIAKVKPAMALSTGQYNEIGEAYVMKIAEKYGERDQFLRDIIIYKKQLTRTGNFTVIKAKEGELISAGDDNVLSLKLFEGNYYDEVQQKDYSKQKREPFVKSYFETYTFNIDISELNDVDMGEKSIDNAYTMLSAGKLSDTIVDLKERYGKFLKQQGASQVSRLNIAPLDSAALRNYLPKNMDTVTAEEPKIQFLENFDIDNRIQIVGFAKNQTTQNISSLRSRKEDNSRRIKMLSKYQVAFHEKFTLAFGCILLFFVGAPLGAIIRKGGLGLPIVIGVVVFLTYHFIGIFAKNSSENGSLGAWLASWLSTLILLPLGIYLTYRATTDQGIFDIDSILHPIKKAWQKVTGARPKD